MAHKIVTTDADFDELGRILAQVKRPLTVEWRQGRDRSLQANALMWKWAGEVAAYFGDRTAREVQHEWKLRYGVPILRSENEAFMQFSEKALRPLNREQRLEAMEFVPVSSIMTVPQMKQLMDEIQRECDTLGIRLTQPEE